MMKLLCKTIFFGFVFFCANASAQNDSINRLEKVTVVADSYLKNKVVGQKTIKITTEQVVKNATNLTETLRFNSPISIRDYGNGGTSSARFRGTSASNTAVMWNGININAVGNGQTGLNSLSLNTSDEIVVKSGGGSVKYGSGAIGGSIHANDNLFFRKHQNFQLFTSYGSFNTSASFYKANIGTKKWAFKLGVNLNKSINDYDLIDDRYKDNNGDYLKNSNGDYKNHGFNLSFGYRFAENNKLSYYTTSYKGNRLLSGELPNPTSANDKYIDLNQRNLLVWSVSKNQFSHVIKTAFLTQEYQYFDNKDVEEYDFGKSKTWLFNYDFTYDLNEDTAINTYVDVQNITGDISSLPASKNREQYSFALAFNSKILKDWKYNIEIKKEFNSAFKVPVVFSLGSNYRLDNYNNLLLHISTNYRVPTLNDLYWPALGNENLIPEKSKQIDVGYQYKNSWLNFKSTLYYMNVLDKITWLPNESGIWVPNNIDESIHQGVEVFLGLSYEFNEYHLIESSSNYTYTSTKDLTTQKELFFVPRHMFNNTTSYQYKKYTVYIQNLSQDKVYTTKENLEDKILEGFKVFNTGFDIEFLKKPKNNLKIGVAVKNIFNQLYLFSNARPMPGRNYNINMNYKF